MKKSNRRKEQLKRVRSGLRLKTKAPRVETPKNVYSRKTKHKRRHDHDSSFFYLYLDFYSYL